MTPTQLALHEAHKARLARMGSAGSVTRQPKQLEPCLPPLHNQLLAVANEILSPKPRVVPVDDARVGGRPTVREIQSAVCEHYDITREELLSRRRTATIVAARHVGFYLARSLTVRSFPEIGRLFDRDHSVPIFAFKKVSNSIEKYRDDIQAIKERLA